MPFSGKNKVVLAMGSANFTSRGLVLSRDQGGNVEVMLRYPPAELAQLPIPLFFDPEASARAVTSECDLADRAEEKIEPEITPFSLRLSEAAVHQDSLELRIDGQELRSEMICQISQAERPSWDLKLGKSEGGVLNAKLASDQQNRLSSAPAIAQIGTGQAARWNALSNPILVTNLRNFLTGGDLSRERQFREVQEGPQRFLNILTLLGDGENQERLKIFLECFNIPFDSDVSAAFPKTLFQSCRHLQVERMRSPGKCELKHFGSLHEAVLGFVERHQRLLDKHVESESAGGIPNFLQILQTACTLLLYQIEGTIDVMSRRSQIDMKAGEWNQVRKNLIRYYVELKTLLRLTTLKYLSKLAGLGPIGPEFSDSIPGLIDFYDRALADRDLLDRLEESSSSLPNCAPWFRCHSSRGNFWKTSNGKLFSKRSRHFRKSSSGIGSHRALRGAEAASTFWAYKEAV